MHFWKQAGVYAALFASCAVAATGTKHTSGTLAPDTRWQTPYYVIDSGVDGPTLLIVGGMHGNEPAGYHAAEQIRHWPIVKGKLVVIPLANRPGMQAKSRYLPGEPQDRRDLNRNFPGERFEEGARGEIARHLWQFVQEQAPDWILDLHEGREFRASHQPPAGTDKSVGSSVIFKNTRRSPPSLDRCRKRPTPWWIVQTADSCCWAEVRRRLHWPALPATSGHPGNDLGNHIHAAAPLPANSTAPGDGQRPDVSAGPDRPQLRGRGDRSERWREMNPAGTGSE